MNRDGFPRRQRVARTLAYLRRMDDFRAQLESSMREAGVEGFDSSTEELAFWKAHGLRRPQAPRARPRQ
jgi:hypothetical protein